MPGSHPKRPDLTGLGEGLGTGILQSYPSHSNMEPGLRTNHLWDGTEKVTEKWYLGCQRRGLPETRTCQPH